MSLFKSHKKKSKEDSPSSGKPKEIVDNSESYNNDSSIGPPLPSSKWVDKSLLLCVNPCVDSYTHTNYDKQIAIPLNSVFNFESKLFKGSAIVRAVDLPSTDKSYFKGRNRKMDFTFQGQFKRRICFDRLYTGQVFDKPFTKLPGQYIISGAIKLVKSLAPALKADINSNTPHMISPLASAAQVFQICKPGEETALPKEPKEDLTLLDKKFVNMKWSDRKSYFHDINHLKEYYFKPGFVYTISCYSHMISPTSYSVHMLGMKWGIQQYIPSPMQIATVVIPRANNNTEKDNDNDETSSNSNETTESNIETSPKPQSVNGNNQIGDDTQIETIGSEELQCESKEDEEQEINIDDNLNDCEFLVNLQVWHTKLVDELYQKDKKHKKSSSGGFKSMFGGK